MNFSPSANSSKSVISLHTHLDSLERFHYENGSARRIQGSGASSIEVSIINDTESDMDTSGELKEVRSMEDSGICERTGQEWELVEGLTRKMDKLSDIVQQQHSALEALREDVKLSQQAAERSVLEHSQMASELINIALVQRLERLQLSVVPSGAGAADAHGCAAAESVRTRAQALLDALERKRAGSLDEAVKEALTEFLQSDALLQHVTAATAEAVKHALQECLASDVTSCLPALDRSHRQLIKQVCRTLDDVFKELEAKAPSRSFKASRSIRSSLERHIRLLEASAEPGAKLVHELKGALQKVLEKELTQWRGKVIDILSENTSCDDASTSDSIQYVAGSPPQPTEAGRSAIDQLMSAAEINAQMRSGDFNGAFEKALLASELSLVMAACRAADPAVALTPGRLQQHVLLSLAQQLAADLLHDTQLKCRYLEGTIMSLDPEHPVTRTHLPKVLAEVCANLAQFLAVYPSHVCSRKIRLLIMAASSLLTKRPGDNDVDN